MRRREFIGLGGAAVTWPLAVRAQQPMPIIGFLDLASAISPQEMVAFREGLSEAGFVEGQNVAFEYRSGDGVQVRLEAMAADLVRRKVAVIIAAGALAPAFAAKAATSTIPIVFANSGDPVKFGLVAALTRPGGNLTGVTAFGTELSGKRLELLCHMIPELMTIAYLTGGPRFPSFEEELPSILAVARAVGRQIIVVSIPSALDIEDSFTSRSLAGIRHRHLPGSPVKQKDKVFSCCCCCYWPLSCEDLRQRRACAQPRRAPPVPPQGFAVGAARPPQGPASA